MTFIRTTMLIGVFLLMQSCGSETHPVTSTIITNATIYDGTGTDGFKGAVRFDGDRIVEVGELSPFATETIIDASGLALAPGFIDTHSHQDHNLGEFRHMPAVLSQGVTTIFRGLDGYSDAFDELAYISQSEFNQIFAANSPAVNVASFSPHNSIRYQVMGDDNRRVATAAEIEAMTEMVEADMRAGAIGFSTGLEYEPGIYSSTEEIVALAGAVAKFGGSYASHMRDEDDRLMESIREVIRIGREAAIRVHVSHIKLADREFWGTADKVIAVLDEARAAGVDITADIYPYTRWTSDLSILFPDRDFSRREDADFTFAHTAAAEDIFLSRYAPNPDFDRLTIAEIAKLTERDIATTLMELAQEADDYLRQTGHSGSTIIAKGMNEDDVAELMQWRFTNICSDGSRSSGHPRGHGTFPRVLRRFVRELGVLTLAEAIHKMTGLPAHSMAIADRGEIQPGMYADLVLFDPDMIADRATMDDPTAVSVGVQYVWVNGALAFENGAPTRRYPGRLLTRAN